MEEGKYMEVEKGTPQGGVISPVLANIYLHCILDLWFERTLSLKLTGHYRYYGISGNMEGLRQYYRETIRLAYKWINRRSQKRSFDWEGYRRFLKWNPLPEPKIYHLTYTLSSK